MSNESSSDDDGVPPPRPQAAQVPKAAPPPRTVATPLNGESSSDDEASSTKPKGAPKGAPPPKPGAPPPARPGPPAPAAPAPPARPAAAPPPQPAASTVDIDKAVKKERAAGLEREKKAVAAAVAAALANQAPAGPEVVLDSKVSDDLLKGNKALEDRVEALRLEVQRAEDGKTEAENELKLAKIRWRGTEEEAGKLQTEIEELTSKNYELEEAKTSLQIEGADVKEELKELKASLAATSQGAEATAAALEVAQRKGAKLAALEKEAGSVNQRLREASEAGAQKETAAAEALAAAQLEAREQKLARGRAEDRLAEELARAAGGRQAAEDAERTVNFARQALTDTRAENERLSAELPALRDALAASEGAAESARRAAEKEAAEARALRKEWARGETDRRTLGNKMAAVEELRQSQRDLLLENQRLSSEHSQTKEQLTAALVRELEVRQIEYGVRKQKAKAFVVGSSFGPCCGGAAKAKAGGAGLSSTGKPRGGGGRAKGGGKGGGGFPPIGSQSMVGSSSSMF